MNDRFKFRVWHSTINKYDDDRFKLTQDGRLNIGGLVVVDPENYIIEQCTGLTDKNGKLIYEGDVLKTVFPDGSSSIKKIIYCMEQARYFLSPYPDKDFPIYWDCKKETVDFLEIIGNIHDDKEQSK